MTVERIKLASIRTDGGTQMRAAINAETVTDYADAYQAGAAMPPVTVFYDGQNYWLGNGFHRVEAQRRLTFKDIDAEVRPGTQRDAKYHAAVANKTNGLRMSTADKQRCVDTLLLDYEWSKKSDRQIAGEVGVSNTFVSGRRAALSVNADRCDGDGRPREVTRNGKTYEQKTGNIGRRTAHVAVANPAGPLGAGMAGEAPSPVVALVPEGTMFPVASSGAMLADEEDEAVDVRLLPFREFDESEVGSWIDASMCELLSVTPSERAQFVAARLASWVRSFSKKSEVA
jgi:hypothetical protein